MALGIAWGLYILRATFWLMWFRGGAGNTTLSILDPGYDMTYVDALVGMIRSLVDGFVAGAFVAWLCNRFQKVFYKSETAAIN
jgi:hypothetical protein